METRVIELKNGKYEIEFEYRGATLGGYWEPPEPAEIDVFGVKTIFGDELEVDDFIEDDLYEETINAVEDLFEEEYVDTIVD